MEPVIVGVAVAAAGAWLVWRLRATVKGEAGCGCAAGKNCGACPAPRPDFGALPPPAETAAPEQAEPAP